MDEQNKPPAWLIPSKVYDVLKWVGLIVCPAAATFMLTAGNSVGIPYTAEIATCITAAGTFIGAIIGTTTAKSVSTSRATISKTRYGSSTDLCASRNSATRKEVRAMIKTLKQTKAAKKLIAIGAAACIATAAMAYAPADSPVAPNDAMAYTQYEQIISNGHGYISPSYLVIHETADPGATADNLMAYWRNNPNAYVVHYTMDLDGDTVYHAMADNRKAWHVGNGNAYTVGIELCHATNKSDFNKQWNEAVKWAGDYLHKNGWGIDRLLCHNDCRLKWGGTDHTDPISYFNSYGKSWSQFKAAVQSYMQSGQFSEATGGSSTSSGGSSASGGHSGTGFGGNYTVMASSLNIRTAPSTSAGIVGNYARGGKVVLDDWYKIADGYVWGKYTAYSGKTRYVAVGKPTGGYDPSDYLVKGGKATSSTGSTKSGGWYTVDVNTALNVRSGPGTNYRITGQLHDGYDLYVQSISNGWAKYQAYTGTRYVSAQYLDAA